MADDERSILVVGDAAIRSDPNLAMTAEVLLCRQGDEAIGAVVQGRAEGRPFAVAFIDYLMPPGPDGLETCLRIREADPNIHLVIVTAKTDVEPSEIAKRVPPLDRFFFLRKPVHPDELRQLCVALAARWRVEEELGAAHAQLEARVEQRTLELRAANQRMEQEIATRLVAQRHLIMAHFALQNAPDPAYWIDEAGRITFANRAAREALGYPLEGPVDLWIWELDPQLKGRWGMRFASLRESGANNIESVHCRADGSVFPVEVSAALLDFETGCYVIAFARDLTHRRNVEAERARLRAAVVVADELVLVLSPELRTLFANPASERLTGYSMAALVGRVPPFLRAGASPVPGAEALLTTLTKTGRWSGRVSHRRKDGSPYQLDITASAVQDAEDHTLSIVLVGREASEIEDLERRLRRSQRMEAIGTLAGGIAHDFNNILAAIHGYTELAMSGDELGPKSRGYMERVLEASRRARDLVRQILAFSRASDEEHRPLNPHLIVNEALRLLRAALPATVRIQTDVDKNCGAVLADPSQMHQVLLNLCTNAQQAMPDGKGVISVVLDQVTLNSPEDTAHFGVDLGTYVRLIVEDDGAGIPLDVREHIFEPFFTTKAQDQGTGMGLATVHSIVSSHNGAISVDSVVGEGSKFTVLLPRHTATVTVEEPEEDVEPSVGASVLVVDDETVLAHMHGEALRIAGHIVATFSDAGTALAAFSADPDRFDVALVDLTMPDMRGDELTREFIKLRPGLPVVLMSGFSERMSQQGAREAGCVEYVLKPIGSRALVRLVARVLRESTLSQA